jgi:hypothetical protein
MNGVLFPVTDLSLDVDVEVSCNDLDDSDGFMDCIVVLRLFSLPLWVAVDLIEVLESIDAAL